MFIVMWRVGKRVGPRIQKIGVRRGVARAEAKVKTAESKPGSGVPQPVSPEAPKLLDTAKSKAKGPTATAVLEALNDLLTSAEAKEGLRALRDKASDSGTYKALESETANGHDLNFFLAEKAVTPKARARVRAKLLEAETDLARAKLHEAETLENAGLRETAREAAIMRLKRRLAVWRIFEDAKVKKAAAAGELVELTGALGEAIQRTQLANEAPAGSGRQVLSNVAVAREIPGYDKIAKWQAAERAAKRPGNAEKLVEHDGKLWELLGEADAILAQDVQGKLQPIRVEETKTGGADKPTSAMAQVDKVVDALGQVAGGAKDLKVFERPGKQTFGRDLTNLLDLSSIGNVQKATRGPAGKGFTENLPYDVEVLRAIAESILDKGFPPTDPHPALPSTSPQRKKEEEPRKGP
jgi:hypothetical protein